ncbi:MAG: hypothetical protein M3O46_22875 [Myxococcota bacterium]|nr:hypothetical protein [Myxococcota bacterium]
MTTLHDGATVPLLLPPQGGRVLFAGVRATNVDGCGMRLTVELRDLASGQMRIDSRKIDLIEDANGWGVSATSGAAGISAVIASFSNLAACPNDWSTTDLNGHQFGLDVSIEDTNGRQAMKSFRVTPSCAQPENFNMCLCICKAGYMPGTPCPS